MPYWCLRCAYPRYAFAYAEAEGAEQGIGNAVHRRRAGDRHAGGKGLTMPSLHVKYCGGCRSGYDRVAWFRGVLSAMRALDGSIVLTDNEAGADIRVAVCGCPAQCVSVPPGTHMLHAPYMDGERMEPCDMAAYLLDMAFQRNRRAE